MGKTYYEKFGIQENASIGEIKSAYRRLAFCYHPDRNGGNKKYENIFKEINKIYRILSIPKLRKEYDEELRRSRSHSYTYGNNQSNFRRSRTDFFYLLPEGFDFASKPTPKNPAIVSYWGFSKGFFIKRVLFLLVVRFIFNNLFNSYDKSAESDPVLPGYVSQNYHSAEVPFDSLHTAEEQYRYMSHALEVNSKLSKMSH